MPETRIRTLPGTMRWRLPNPAALLRTLSSQCAVCHSWPAQRVCSSCAARFSPSLARCTSCALALLADLSQGTGTRSAQCGACIRKAPPLDACFAAVTYGYPWSDIISSFKFGGEPAWSSVLAALLLRTPGVQQALGALAPDDLLLPLPLSAARLQSRGFNQSWELASALARQGQTAARTDTRLLLRIRDTPPQAQLKREARLHNVRGAFVVDPLRVSLLQGKHVVLVDDVMTSGASLFSAAQALREAGAASVTGLVFARTEAI